MQKSVFLISPVTKITPEIAGELRDYVTGLEGQGYTPRADAIITEMPFIALMVKQADCQGVILFDPEQRVLANVHCGWRGSVRNH